MQSGSWIYNRFEKFDNEVIKKFETMGKTVSIADCPCSAFRNMMADNESDSDETQVRVDRENMVCFWPALHQDLEAIFTQHTFGPDSRGACLEQNQG